MAERLAFHERPPVWYRKRVGHSPALDASASMIREELLDSPSGSASNAISSHPLTTTMGLTAPSLSRMSWLPETASSLPVRLRTRPLLAVQRSVTCLPNESCSKRATFRL